MEHVSFSPRGVCAMKIDFDIDEGKLHNVRFTGGCNGNLKAIARLVDGWHYMEIVKRVEGNTCGFRPTSCADQLSKALLAAAEKAGIK